MALSLEDLGNLGEFLAAIAVIITLIYLAFQIRQNTRQISQNTQSLRLAAGHAFKRDTQDLRVALVHDAEAARILRTGLGDVTSLNDDERARFNLLLAAIIEHIQFAFERREEGLVEWDAQRAFMLSYFSQPGVQEWWKSGRQIFNAAFVRYVEEELLAKGGGSGPHWLP
jgi:hypothetical protein